MLTQIEPSTLSPEQHQWLIDVRDPDEFAQEHIPGATNIPLSRLGESSALLQKWPQVILTCQSGKRAEAGYHILQQQGLTQLSLLKGSLNAWKAFGKETVRKNGKSAGKQPIFLSVMQQTQIVIGLMVLSGLLYAPLWFLPYVAGAGLLFAGLSNTCMLALVISKLPWNSLSKAGNCCTPNTTNCSSTVPL